MPDPESPAPEQSVTHTETTEVTAPAGQQPAAETPPPLTAAELAIIRDLTIRANPDAVPELITGDSVTEIAASVETAKAAYSRLTEQLRAQRGPTVPAGGAPAPTVDISTLSPAQLIQRAVAQRRQK